MAVRMLEAGITAIQAGNRAEGARLLRIALKRGELTGAVAATAYLWLAETTDDPAQKRNYYNDALNADPGNPDATARLTATLTAGRPPSPAAPAPPVAQATVAFRPAAGTGPLIAPEPIACVIGGPNGAGTAFFVHPQGVLVTTRFVVGGLERLTVELAGRRQVAAQVFRAWPELDLALLRVEASVRDLAPIAPAPQVPDEMPLIAVTGDGKQAKGKQRPSRRVIAPHWIMTDFAKAPDAGGNPLYDSQGYLVGMLTQNSSRASSYRFGVHITAIQRHLAIALHELNEERRAYCPSCGTLSLAIPAGYFHCEVCGALAGRARDLPLHEQPDPLADPNAPPCPACGARVGFHGGRCLRCGQAAAR